MKLIVAEKPSVAKDIARIVGARTPKDGYMEGNGYFVTWAFGHLLSLAPENVPGWNWDDIPVKPTGWKLSVAPGKDKKPDPGKEKQLRIIKRLMEQSSEVINAGDAGREGENIQRRIYEWCGCRIPVKRLWVSSLTDEAIRGALSSMKPASAYDNLYEAARARSKADYIVGVSATVALTLAARGGDSDKGVKSLGRVQTPTLAMICRRYLENKNFVKTPFWNIKVTTVKDGKTFFLLSEKRFETEDAAEEALVHVQAVKDIIIKEVEVKKGKSAPPHLFSLSDLQKEASRVYKMGVDRTLEVAQSLYEKHYTTYPRTSSQYITEDILKTIPHLLDTASKHPVYGTYAQQLKGQKLNRWSVDDKKVSDHHALLITDVAPKGLDGDEEKIYSLILARMLEAFSPVCEFTATTVKAEAGGVPLHVGGRVIDVPGWRAVRKESSKDDSDEDTQSLPSLREGETLPILEANLLQGETKPKPLYTGGTLVDAMKKVGKDEGDEDVRRALLDCEGIGTEATRANIIKELKNTRHYIEADSSDKLRPTELGLQIYELVKDMDIANPAMTGKWEESLGEISAGAVSPAQFEKGIAEYTAKVVEEIRNSPAAAAIHGKEAVACTCPRCGGKARIGMTKKGVRFAKCGECNLILWGEKCGKKLSEKEIAELMNKGAALIKGYTSPKTGNKFDALTTVELPDPNDEKQFASLMFDFENTPKKSFAKSGGKKKGRR